MIINKMPTRKELYKIAQRLNISGRSSMRKADLELAINHKKSMPRVTIKHRSRSKSPKVRKSKSPKVRKSRSPKVRKAKSLKKTVDKEPIITITCGDVAENHVGNQQIGHLVPKGHGFNKGDLELAAEKFRKKGYVVELHDLNTGLDGVLVDGKPPRAEEASILIVRNGLEALIGKGKSNKFFKELVGLDWDKKFYDTRRKKVLNKHARHNLCFSKNSQEPEYLKGKGRIVAYSKVPRFEKIMKALPKYFGPKSKKLQAEGNKYFNKSKTGIGYHGDTERRKVVAWRLGEGNYGDERSKMPIHWQWYIRSKPVGKNMKFDVFGGDIYAMSEKATGQDWKKKIYPGSKSESMPTLRHAAGSKKYTQIKTK